jgi:hypothetical protein
MREELTQSVVEPDQECKEDETDLLWQDSASPHSSYAAKTKC